jgi:hypothetical protein
MRRTSAERIDAPPAFFLIALPDAVRIDWLTVAEQGPTIGAGRVP